MCDRVYNIFCTAAVSSAGYISEKISLRHQTRVLCLKISTQTNLWRKNLTDIKTASPLQPFRAMLSHRVTRIWISVLSVSISESVSTWLQSAGSVHACIGAAAASQLRATALCIFGNTTSELCCHAAPERERASESEGSDSIKIWSEKQNAVLTVSISNRPQQKWGRSMQRLVTYGDYRWKRTFSL